MNRTNITGGIEDIKIFECLENTYGSGNIEYIRIQTVGSIYRYTSDIGDIHFRELRLIEYRS